MSDQPTIRIKGKPHDYPASSKLGDAALIERVTDLTHAEWRKRYRASLEAVLDEDETVEEDSAISVGIVAMAVARANPRWSRGQVAEYVTSLDWEEIEFEPGDPDPLDAGPESGQTAENGNGSASQSSSESVTGSSESTIQPTSGIATSPTSPAERSGSMT